MARVGSLLIISLMASVNGTLGMTELGSTWKLNILPSPASLISRGYGVTLLKGETSRIRLGSCEYLLGHKTNRIDIWQDTGQKEPFIHHPAFWPDGSPPDDPVQIDIQILCDPPLATPFRGSHRIHFDQQDSGVVIEKQPVAQ